MDKVEKVHIVRNKVVCVAGCLKGIEKDLADNKPIKGWLKSIIQHVLEMDKCERECYEEMVDLKKT